MLALWTRRRVESELTVSFLAAAAPFVAPGAPVPSGTRVCGAGAGSREGSRS